MDGVIVILGEVGRQSLDDPDEGAIAFRQRRHGRNIGENIKFQTVNTNELATVELEFKLWLARPR